MKEEYIRLLTCVDIRALIGVFSGRSECFSQLKNKFGKARRIFNIFFS
jgi:hypothetical protein